MLSNHRKWYYFLFLKRVSQVKNFFIRHWIFFAQLSVIGFSAYFIVNYNQIQKKVFPSKYWKAQVSEIKNHIQSDLAKKELLQKNLEKERSLSLGQVNLLQEIHSSTISENQEDETLKTASEEKIQKIVQEIDLLNLSLKDSENKLELAEKKYELSTQK